MRYIGIDPGKGGGVACIDDEERIVSALPMPATERDLLSLLTGLAVQEVTGEPSVAHRCVAVLEFVRATPQMGVVSAWTFGVGYGGLRMALTARNIPFDEVLPIRWQNAMGCRTRGDKNVSKRRAQDLFPGVKVTHALADALLLAEYGRRVKTGQLATPVKPVKTKEF